MDKLDVTPEQIKGLKRKLLGFWRFGSVKKPDEILRALTELKIVDNDADGKRFLDEYSKLSVRTRLGMPESQTLYGLCSRLFIIPLENKDYYVGVYER